MRNFIVEGAGWEFQTARHTFYKGTATPQHEIDLIKARLKRAEDHYKANYVKGTRT
jgi:hypothetical protein